jgi:predicted nucleic acid-binding protein
MIVVADASPLHYLVQIECVDLLQNLYGRVVVPTGVMMELRHASTPASVALWATNLPAWIEVCRVRVRKDPDLEVLDPGEREAIQLAEDQYADLLLIDDRKGRSVARRRGIVTTGTLGVLLAARKRGLIDAEATLLRLINETSFRATSEIQQKFVEMCRELRSESDSRQFLLSSS